MSGLDKLRVVYYNMVVEGAFGAIVPKVTSQRTFTQKNFRKPSYSRYAVKQQIDRIEDSADYVTVSAAARKYQN